MQITSKNFYNEDTIEMIEDVLGLTINESNNYFIEVEVEKGLFLNKELVIDNYYICPFFTETLEKKQKKLDPVNNNTHLGLLSEALLEFNKDYIWSIVKEGVYYYGQIIQKIDEFSEEIVFETKNGYRKRNIAIIIAILSVISNFKEDIS